MDLCGRWSEARMAPFMDIRGFFTGCAATLLLSTQATAFAEASPKPPGSGFDRRPVILAEAGTDKDAGITVEQNVEAQPPVDPDSQPVLEQQAREGNTEALAKEAQNNDFFLISRTIIPMIQRPLAGTSDVIGIGDINPTIFLVPRTTSRFQFGFGPTLVIPSATDVQLSMQRWSAGPAGVAVYTRGALVAGILANNIWSFAGEGGRQVNSMLIQPFLNINLANGWYIASSPIIPADWTANNGRGWTVPKADESRNLLQRLAGLYNQHRPSTWPAYQPRGNGLGTKLRQALRQAGSADALADTLTAALQSMPPFWRTTSP